MSTLFQPGQHPDADQLNAFVEHALPLHEQQATLAHLAACADCRAIVYFAQPAVLEAPAQPQPVRTRAPLFARWMLAFPAAAALACLIFLTVHFRDTTSHQIAVPNTAHIETPPPPPAAPPESAAPPASAPAPVHTPPAATVPAPRTPPPAAVAASPHATPPPVSFGLASTPKPEIATAPTRPEKKAGLGAMSGASYVSPPPLPPPAAASPAVPVSPTAPQPSLAASAAARRELRSAATQYDMPRAQAQQAAAPVASAANNGDSGIYGGTGQTNLNENYIAGVPVSSAAATTVSAAPASTATAADATAVDQLSASTDAPALRQAKSRPTLPSKLAALSVATSAHRHLAIDTAGTLFRSEDAGSTWQPVPVQWTGRAIKVALVPSPNARLLAKSAGSLSAPPAEANRSAAPSAQPPTFELTTDDGDLWISTDGQIWTRK